MQEITLTDNTAPSPVQKSFRFFLRLCKVLGRFLLISGAVAIEVFRLVAKVSEKDEDIEKQHKENYDFWYGQKDPMHIHIDEKLK